MFHLFVLSVLRGVESGHVVQRAAVEVASGTLEERRVREANWTLQQGRVGGSTPLHLQFSPIPESLGLFEAADSQRFFISSALIKTSWDFVATAESPV